MSYTTHPSSPVFVNSSGSSGYGGGGGGGSSISITSNNTMAGASGGAGPITFRQSIWPPVPRGETFDDADVLYPTGFRLHRPHHSFHFDVWREVCPESQRWGFISEASKGDPILVFGDRRDRDEFTKWLERYCARFQDNDIAACPLPSLPRGRMKGTVIPRPRAMQELQFASDDGLAEAKSIWAWIVGNAKRPVWFTNESVVFEREADAVAFRLRWSI